MVCCGLLLTMPGAPSPPQMLKERASGMYRLSAFYFARTASDLPMDFAVPTIFLVIICEPLLPFPPAACPRSPCILYPFLA